MSLFPTKAHRSIPCLFALLLTFSCSKDSDLLADYVIPGTPNASDIRRFVVDDSFVVFSNSENVLDVLANDDIAPTDEVKITETSDPVNGTVSINEDETVTYTPDNAEVTEDSFSYTTELVNNDASISQETGIVTVTISDDENLSIDKDSGSLKAFPGAYGGGSKTVGGRGGKLVIVNTLNFDAPLIHDADKEVYEGGLKAAFTSNIGPRYIIFSVSGVIDGGNSEISVNNGGDITVFGQSAPKGGITLYRGWLDMNMSENVIMRYLTIRPGVAVGNPISDDSSSTGIQIGHKDIIIDHCSTSWGGDKGIIAGDWQYGFPLQNISVQNCIIADSHSLGFTVDGKNGGAGDWDVAGNISWHYNLMSGGNRTPNLGGFDGLGVIQNNVVQSNGSKLSTIVYASPKINHIGNYYVAHNNGIIPNRFQDVGNNSAKIYSKNNYYENLSGTILNGVSSENNEKIWINTKDNKQLTSNFFTENINSSSIPNEPPVLSPMEAMDFVLKNAGANKYLDDYGNVKTLRDSYDQVVIANFEKRIMAFRKFASDWTLPISEKTIRPASYDSDKDGMSDAWEMNIIGSLDQGYNDDHDGDGYTNIEEYYNQVDF